MASSPAEIPWDPFSPRNEGLMRTWLAFLLLSACTPDLKPGADSGPIGTDGDADTDTDADTDVDTDIGYAETGPCTPTDVWTGPVPPALLTHTPFDESYDAGLDLIIAQTSGGGSGSWGSAMIVIDGTIVAVGDEPRWDYISRYHVSDGFGAVLVNVQGDAEVGDTVTFALNGYEDGYGGALLNNIGSWTVTSSGNPVPARHLGAATVDYTDHYSQLVHEAGELLEPSSLNCGDGYTCFVFEHDGVRDRVRLPALNDFGLDVDYDGGLCAEVIAPAGQYRDGGVVQGYFIDVPDASWMRVWPAP